MTHVQICHPSPLGPLYLVASADALHGLYFQPRPLPVVASCPTPGAGAILREVVAQLDAYLRGARRDFALPLQLAGTPFQQRVWQQLTAIPYGDTRSYRDIAMALGAPLATRAVGAANGRNPISIIVPCHRVIASDGTLGGYGGGLAHKARLLQLEGCRPPRASGLSAQATLI